MENKKVYAAISGVASALAEQGIRKERKQGSQVNYAFRGIDDIYNALAPELVKHKAFCIPTEETAIDADAEVHQVQPAAADQILAEFTQYASTENDSKTLQERYATTWSRLNGFADHQAKCKDVTGIRIREIKQAA